MIDTNNLDKLVEFIPESKPNLERLGYLQKQASKPRIAVFGSYNHGKSTLLNAIIGKEEIFKTADKRETLINSEIEHDGVIWVDTPGLNADVKGKDDARAKEAFKVADYIFLVHSLNAGELDKSELRVYTNLMKQDKNYKAKLFLILTKVDQVSKDDLALVTKNIKKQLPDLTTIPVSAIRYLKGVTENKPKFIELSGMDQLQTQIAGLKYSLSKLRNKEIRRLKNKAAVELKQAIESKKQELITLETIQRKSERKFTQSIDNLFSTVKQKLQSI